MPDPTPTDLVLAVAHGRRVLIDDLESPTCVTVHTSAGPRHFFGGSIASALERAACGLTPRLVTRDPEDPL